mgnify:CR=1 FL=1
MSVASRILILLLCSSFAGAEDLMVTLAGRPVGTVRVLGGTDSDTRFALNNLRSLAGSPLDAAIVRADIRRLTELGRFSEVVAKVTERVFRGVHRKAEGPRSCRGDAHGAVRCPPAHCFFHAPGRTHAPGSL